MLSTQLIVIVVEGCVAVSHEELIKRYLVLNRKWISRLPDPQAKLGLEKDTLEMAVHIGDQELALDALEHIEKLLNDLEQPPDWLSSFVLHALPQLKQSLVSNYILPGTPGTAASPPSSMR